MQVPPSERGLRRRLRQWRAMCAVGRTYRAMVKVHKICVENSEGASYERRLRPTVQRTRDLMDEARKNIGARDDNDWHRAMCMSENGTAMCDGIDEEREVGSVAAFSARFKRRQQRRNPPAPQSPGA